MIIFASVGSSDTYATIQGKAMGICCDSVKDLVVIHLQNVISTKGVFSGSMVKLDNPLNNGLANFISRQVKS